MKENKAFKFAYVGMSILILFKYFYEWLIRGSLDFYLLFVIVASSMLFIIGNIFDKKR